MGLGKTQAGGSYEDAAMPHKYGKLWLDVQTAEGHLHVTGGIVGQGAGAPVFSALSVAASELTGLLIGGDGDECYWRRHIADLNMADLDQDIEGRVLWESGGGAADGDLDWTLHLKGVALGEVFTDGKSSSDSGSIAFAAGISTLAGALYATEWKNLAVAGELNDDTMIMVACTCAAMGDASADEIRLLGVELRYTRSIMSSSGMRQITGG